MNIIPALMKQKALLITGGLVILLLVIGAAYVSQTSDVQDRLSFPGAPAQADTVSLRLNAIPTSQTETEYVLTFAETEAAAVTGMSIRLIGYTDTLAEQTIEFDINPDLVTQGWQAPISASSVESEVDSTVFKYELALLRISTEQSVISPETRLGSFRVLGDTDGLEFQLDPSISTAILSDGTEVQLTLVR